MMRKPVASSSLRTVGYDAHHNVLEVEFHSQHVYRYFQVANGVYEALMGASSKGRYFAYHIRDRYPCEQID
jgi:hypothetical protein